MGEQTMHPMEDDPDGQDSVRDVERAAFDRGFQMAARIEQLQMRQVAATMVLAVLGKDAADGAIDLGALGRWYYTAMGAVEVTA